MTSKSIFIVGSSGHGRSVLDVVRRHYTDSEIFFFDDFKIKNSIQYGIKVLGPIEEISEAYKKYGAIGVIIAIGNNWDRYLVYRKVKKYPEANFISAVHPSADIGNDVIINHGTVIMPGAVIGPGVHIGSHCIINSHATVEHDCILDDFSHIAPGAVLAGNVRLGLKSYVGLGAKIIEKRNIGSNAVIGAGAVVLSDIQNDMIAYGVPAKEIRQKKSDEKYF